MPTLPTNRTSANTVAEHVDDHNALHAFYNAQSGSSVLKDFDFKTRSSANVTVNGTAYADLDTGLDIVLTAASGDVIEVSAAGRWATENVQAYMDVATIVSGSPVNYVSGSGSTGEGVQSWQGYGNANTNIAGTVMYTLVSGDISSGTVTLRLRVRTLTAANKTFVSGSTNVFKWSAKNYGPIT